MPPPLSLLLLCRSRPERCHHDCSPPPLLLCNWLHMGLPQKVPPRLLPLPRRVAVKGTAGHAQTVTTKQAKRGTEREREGAMGQGDNMNQQRVRERGPCRRPERDCETYTVREERLDVGDDVRKRTDKRSPKEREIMRKAVGETDREAQTCEDAGEDSCVQQ